MENFEELNLSPELKRAISELGFEKPSDIQAQSLPILLGKPTDFMGLAATGTGKTAAFAIPLIENIKPEIRSVQGLILLPTRELALQVAGQINLLGKFKGIKALPVYGGSGYADQIHGLKSGATIVVGTPGRVVDHLNRGTLVLNDLHTLILDEADEMISMGFKEELEKVLDSAPRETSQIWCFSATMSSEVRRVADQYLRAPQFVKVNKTEMVPSTIEQLYYMTRESNKAEILCKLMETAEDFYGLIFCQTKLLVTDLTQYLNDRGYKVDCLHGDKDQKSRERTMQAFREKRVKILVCTDVASRGLDVKDITHVINYSLPRELDNYVHRIGRTARSGKTGIAMSLVTPSHRHLIRSIERMTKSAMAEGQIPTRKDVGVKRAAKIFEKFEKQAFGEKATELFDENWIKKLGEMNSQEVAGKFLAMLLPELFEIRPEMQMPGAQATGQRPPRRSSEQSRGSDRPRYQGGGRSQDRSRYQERPRYAERSRLSERPRTEERSRTEDRPRTEIQPRTEVRSVEDRPARRAPEAKSTASESVTADGSVRIKKRWTKEKREEKSYEADRRQRFAPKSRDSKRTTFGKPGFSGAASKSGAARKNRSGRPSAQID